MKPSTRRRTTRLGHLITNVDLSQHDIDPTRIWMAAVAAMALEAAGQVLDKAGSENATIRFPWEWGATYDGRGGKRVEHPMIACVSLPIGWDDSDPPEWAIDLRDMVRDMISSHVPFREAGSETAKIVDESVPILKPIADGFRELAAMIDAAMPDEGTS